MKAKGVKKEKIVALKKEGGRIRGVELKVEKVATCFISFFFTVNIIYIQKLIPFTVRREERKSQKKKCSKRVKKISNLIPLM
jgi:transposase